MVGEQIQNYVSLVAGVRRATKAKAAEAAQGLLTATGLDDVAADASERVSNLAEEIIAASRANRELLVKMITSEVDKVAARVGFARAEDLEALRAELAELRAILAEQSARAETAEAVATEAAATTAAGAAAEAAATSAEEVTRASAKKAPAAQKTPAQRTTATKASATKTAKKVPTQTSPAQKSPAQRSPAQKSPAQRSATKKAPRTPPETA